jgi:hypothetical protein
MKRIILVAMLAVLAGCTSDRPRAERGQGQDSPRDERPVGGWTGLE